MLPSISIDDGVFKYWSSEAFAEVLDQFGGIEHYSGTAVGLHLQKFWISLAESSDMSALEQRFEQPKGVKLALEWRFGQPEGVKLALEQRFGQSKGVKLALEWRFGQPEGIEFSLERRHGRPGCVKFALERRFRVFRFLRFFDDPKPRPEIYG